MSHTTALTLGHTTTFIHPNTVTPAQVEQLATALFESGIAVEWTYDPYERAAEGLVVIDGYGPVTTPDCSLLRAALVELDA